MKAPIPDEAEALAGLREHEQELDRHLEEARVEAKGLLEKARQEADGLRGKAEADLGDEVAHLRDAQARDLARRLEETREETGRRSQVLCRRAEQNRERALAWLLSRVAGRDGP